MLGIPIVTEFNGKGIKKAIAEFKRLETTGQKAQFALKKAAIPAAAALTAIAGAAVKSLKAGEAVATANARILQVNKSMGLFGSETEAVTDRLIKLAEATALSTGMDNLSIKATQAKLLTFGKLAKTADRAGGAFDRATMAAIDMAAAGFGSAETNAVQLGKALNDPIKGINSLTRSGITFTAKEKEKIKTLIETNKVLEAQDLVLQAIEKQVGGTAIATANDTDKMREAFNQFQQALGLSLMPILEEVTPKLLGMAQWAKDNPETFTKIAGAIGLIAGATIAVNLAMAANPYVLAAAGVIGLAVAFERLFTALDNISKVGGIAARIAGALIGAPGAAQNLIDKGLRSVIGRDTPSGIGPLPGGTNIAPAMAPSIATNANRGVMVTVNTGVGDPVAIGKEVNNVLNAYLRRGS